VCRICLQVTEHESCSGLVCFGADLDVGGKEDELHDGLACSVRRMAGHGVSSPELNAMECIRIGVPRGVFH
jgi:hypothetical protein